MRVLNEASHENSKHFIVDKIGPHMTENGETKKLVHWYGYSAKADSTELTPQFPKHFVVCFWKRKIC